MEYEYKCDILVPIDTNIFRLAVLCSGELRILKCMVNNSHNSMCKWFGSSLGAKCSMR